MSEKRKRGQNFSLEEKDKLVKILLSHKDTILNKKTDGATIEAKSQAWMSVVETFNSSASVYRNKESLMEIWEKMKTESKLYYNSVKRSTSQTGGGPSIIKIDPVMEQVCSILGRACTGITGVNDCDFEETEIIIATEDSALPKVLCVEAGPLSPINEDSEKANHSSQINYFFQFFEIKKTPLWSRRRPRISQTNERSEAVSTLCSSFQEVNKKKESIEEMRIQLLQDEIEFKSGLYKLQLQAAEKEVQIKTEILNQIKGTLLVLLVAVSYSSTFDDSAYEDYSEEDPDYDIYFEKYDPGTTSMWDLASAEKTGQGSLNIQGSLRARFAPDTALTNTEKSMVCSPISVLLSLGKLTLAAEGKSLTQLLGAMGIKKKTQLKKAFKPLIKNLEYLNGINLKIVSKMYISNELRIRSRFRKRARKIFRSSVSAMDFKKPASAARNINEYIERKTKNGIQNVVSEHDISPKTSVLLVNAVFFTGYWEKEFKKIETTSFYSSKSTRSVSMMSRSGRYKYGNSEPLDARLVQIPYEGGQTYLLVVLPNKKNTLSVVLEKIKLAPQLIKRAVHKMVPTDLILSIPRFKTELKMDLNVAFEKLGITNIFNTRSSGLEGILKERKNIHLSKSVHKAIIVVSEHGTAGASVSESGIKPISMNLDKTIFNANHPFLYFVIYKGEQIFAGTLV